MNTTEKGNEFENQVFCIFEKTYPKSIEFYRGGSDRGRDIVVIYEHNGLSKTVIVECKNYNSSVSQKDICDSLNWAVSTKPDLFYIWTNSYITPSAKDYILSVARQYKLNVAWEEKNSLQKYINECKAQNKDECFTSLKNRIFELLNIESISNQLEYTSRILPSNHALINRKKEKKILLDNEKHFFYLVGPSCVGKTQLAKNIAKQHFKEGRFVFWHRVLIQDSECQIKNLLDALGIFFSCVLKRNDLSEYLNNHGCFLTSSLINITKAILSNYECAIFIDDIHKCNCDNYQYIEFLMQLLEIQNSKIYLLGWFNIFDISDFKLNNTITFVDVEPLSAQHIRKIALKNNKTLNENELNDIVKRCDGLPGLAEVIPANKSHNNLGGLLSYFRSIISFMETKEKSLLFSLALSRVPLPIKLLERLNYHIACKKLTQKRLTKFEGDIIVLHDMYKKHITNLLYLMPEDTLIVLEYCAEDIPLIYIDILILLCKINRIDRYDILLKDKFTFLLSMGYDVMLLNTLQEREKINKRNALNILIKKMILLERKSEYDLLANYINITKDIIDETNEDYYMWNYIYMRFRYFRCNFLSIIKDFYNNIEKYNNYPIDLYLQILFIIGRTYYVIGEMKIAAEIYYYIFNLAVRNNLSNLSIKAIHRICIIEEKIGLFKEAAQTLKELISPRCFVSLKRQAFAYYRLSKCALGNKDFETAIKYNDKSVEIKESLNAQRGIIFSMKLYSQIYYKKNDIPRSIYWGEEALKKAQELNICKEEVATGIVYAQALLASNQKQEAENILNSSIEQSSNMHLGYRLKSIINLCNEHGLVELRDNSTNALQYSERYIGDMRDMYKRHLRGKIENNADLNKIDDLFNHKKALTPLLAML